MSPLLSHGHALLLTKLCVLFFTVFSNIMRSIVNDILKNGICNQFFNSHNDRILLLNIRGPCI